MTVRPDDRRGLGNVELGKQWASAENGGVWVFFTLVRLYRCLTRLEDSRAETSQDELSDIRGVGASS